MTYMPGLAVVPCAVCQTPINRRGSSGAGHRKYCDDPQCRQTGHLQRAREREGRTPRRTNGICPKCNVEPRHPRPDGRLRGWCPKCESRQKAEYMRTNAGRATWRRWYHKTTGSTRYAYLSGQPDVPCYWCGTQIHRRGQRGAGHRMYCQPSCCVAGQRHRANLKKARRR